MNKLKTILAIVLLGAAFNLTAQQSINASGGEAIGAGHASYSIGQVSYTAINEVGGAGLIQGVQIPFEIFTTLSSLTGTVLGFAGCGEREMTMVLYNENTSNITLFDLTIDSNGDYNSIESPIGTYEIYATIQGYLTKRYSNVPIENGSNQLNISELTPGDLNNSNSVNVADISLLQISFGSSEVDANYNFIADYNCNGSINIVDFSLLLSNFGLQGDYPPQ